MKTLFSRLSRVNLVRVVGWDMQNLPVPRLKNLDVAQRRSKWFSYIRTFLFLHNLFFLRPTNSPFTIIWRCGQSTLFQVQWLYKLNWTEFSHFGERNEMNLKG